MRKWRPFDTEEQDEFSESEKNTGSFEEGAVPLLYQTGRYATCGVVVESR